MPIVKSAVFVLVTAVILYVSGRSLLDTRSHGFYRALAWEAILIVLLLNVDVWFRDPFSWHQVVSWLLLSVSGWLVVQATVSLRRRGKPDPQRDDAHLIGIEKTTALVTVGAYRFIRHPMYSSLLFLAWGTFFKAPSWAAGLAAAAGSLFLLATAKVEERENLRYFGRAYADYMKQTKLFVPFLL